MAKLNFIKLCGFIIPLFGVLPTLQAQDRILPSPDGAALVQSINVPTNLYTGTASVQIPLCTLETLGGPAINVGLSYQASGIKVTDRETNYGLGWQLTGGGRITRVVRGKPDEDGYRADFGVKHGELIQSELLNKADFERYVHKDYKFDGEPDLYYFQTPTCSGAFVIDYTGEICLMPYQDININMIGVSGFEIIDMSGIKYVFGSTVLARETTFFRASKNGSLLDEREYTSSWLLEKIIANDRVITRLGYDSYDMSMLTNDTVRIYRAEGHLSYSLKKTEVNTILIRESNAKYINEITTDCGNSITFLGNSGNINRANVQMGPQNNKIYYFDYRFLSDGRRILNEINVMNEASAQKLIAKFDYFDMEVPQDYKTYSDHWGYYNGPSTYSLKSESSVYGGVVQFHSYDRTPKIEYAKHGVLKSIIYPTGGYKEFEYEAHKCIDYEVQGGLRIKSISEYESSGTLAEKTEYFYDVRSGYLRDEKPRQHIVLDQGKSINGKAILQYSVAEKAINTSHDFAGISAIYQNVKEVFRNGSYRIHSFVSERDFPDISGMVKWYKSNDGWRADKHLIVPNTSKFWGRGMPKKIIEYTAEGDTISHIEYQYDTLPSKKVKANILLIDLPLINWYSSDEYEYNYLIGRYEWISQPVRLASIETFATDYSLPSLTTFTYADNPPVPDRDYPTLVRSTTRTNVDGEKLTTIVKYPFDYHVVSTSTNNQLKALYNLKNRHMINTPIETLTYNSDGKIIHGELNKFTMKDNSVVLDEKMSLRQQHPSYQGFVIASVSGNSLTYNSLYKTDMKYYEYTDKLLPSIYKTGDGPIQAVEYGHNGLYPIATFNNAYTEQDLQNGNRIIYRDILTSTTTIPVSWRGAEELEVSYSEQRYDTLQKHRKRYILDISNIRTNGIASVTIPVQGDYTVKDLVIAPRYTTFSSSTLIPGIGKTSETDVNGVSVYYDYDLWGRVKKVLDKDMNVLKETEYGY